jgi:endonuclease/exonuclease/phosphatase family metal-dependent hydrolase
MGMRLASFNLENLFQTAAIYNLASSYETLQKLKDYYQLSALIEKRVYSDIDKKKIIDIMNANHGLASIDKKSDLIRLNEIRGYLLNQSFSAVESSGRDDWIGWFELIPAAVEQIAFEYTARVINAVKADFLCAIEVESRVAVNRFNENVIPMVDGGEKYEYTMVIDGNDERGIDVGILTKEAYEISSIGTHVYDSDQEGMIFRRDCAEYTIQTPLGNSILLLVNHFKSQGGTTPSETDENDRIRNREAKRVRQIYEEKLDQGIEFIAITGDLNHEPSHDSLQPLLGNGSSLLDIMTHPKFRTDNLSWTYKRGRRESKLDYILLSPKLQEKVHQAGIERRGIWREKNDDSFECFPEVKREIDGASDHAALWVDLDI